MPRPASFRLARFLPLVALLAVAAACDSDAVDTTPGELAAAYAEFDTDNVSITLDGSDVLIESNGMPNHTSPYWSNTTERTNNGPRGGQTTPAAAVDHPLFVAPTTTTYDRMTPGNIDDFNGSYSLTVPVSPTGASATAATGLGPIGIAVSGAMIFNDQEGPSLPLDDAIGGFDENGAHTGPQSYHYHLEPVAITQDDDALVGVIADGFFLYGRRDADGTHPDDIDASGGHTGPTPHNTDGEYHYHIQNELYLGTSYILFPGDYQGTPNAIR